MIVTRATVSGCHEQVPVILCCCELSHCLYNHSAIEKHALCACAHVQACYTHVFFPLHGRTPRRNANASSRSCRHGGGAQRGSHITHITIMFCTNYHVCDLKIVHNCHVVVNVIHHRRTPPRQHPRQLRALQTWSSWRLDVDDACMSYIHVMSVHQCH